MKQTERYVIGDRVRTDFEGGCQGPAGPEMGSVSHRPSHTIVSSATRRARHAQARPAGPARNPCRLCGRKEPGQRRRARLPTQHGRATARLYRFGISCREELRRPILLSAPADLLNPAATWERTTCGWPAVARRRGYRAAEMKAGEHPRRPLPADDVTHWIPGHPGVYAFAALIQGSDGGRARVQASTGPLVVRARVAAARAVALHCRCQTCQTPLGRRRLPHPACKGCGTRVTVCVSPYRTPTTVPRTWAIGWTSHPYLVWRGGGHKPSA